MAQTELFKRYIWLVNLMINNKETGLTREQINEQWSGSSLNNRHETALPERTFHRHKEAIKELFDLDIVCRRGAEKRYHIANLDSLNREGFTEWLLNVFAMRNLLAECQDLKSRILFEPLPCGQQFLTSIIEAMRAGKAISLSYQSFLMDCPMPHLVEPYCLKIYKQRWYLLGRRPERDVMRVFALDRIHGIEITNHTFLIPSSFDADKYFENTVGIMVEEDCPPQSVSIKAMNGCQNYLRSLPLHPSQKEYETATGEAKFSLFLQPNNDLIQELLRYGKDIEVLRPKWFRDKFQQIVDKMSNNYNEE